VSRRVSRNSKRTLRQAMGYLSSANMSHRAQQNHGDTIRRRECGQRRVTSESADGNSSRRRRKQYRKCLRRSARHTWVCHQAAPRNSARERAARGRELEKPPQFRKRTPRILVGNVGMGTRGFGPEGPPRVCLVSTMLPQKEQSMIDYFRGRHT
jgi:hypothetical protein